MWRKDRNFGFLALREICGEVLGKSPKPEAVKKILIVDRDKIHGNRSCSPETW
jgi:hypothetical protein